MKNLQKIAFTLMLTLVFAACGGSGGSSGGDAYLTAKADGTSFTALESLVSAKNQSGVLVVQGSDSSGKAINFSMPSYGGTGTYTTASGTFSLKMPILEKILPKVNFTHQKNNNLLLKK